jgi:hypothetical protein
MRFAKLIGLLLSPAFILAGMATIEAPVQAQEPPAKPANPPSSAGRSKPAQAAETVKASARVVTRAEIKRPGSLRQLRRKYSDTTVTVTTIRDDAKGRVVHYLDFQ